MRSESLQSFDGSLRSCKKQKPCSLISPVMLERTGYVISAHLFRLCHHPLSLISSLPQVFRITPGCVTVGFPCCLTLVKLQKLLWSCWIASWLVVHHRILLEFPFRAWSSLAARRPYVVTSATKITALLGSNVLLRCEATGHPTPTLTWIKSAMPNIHKQGIFLYTHVAYFIHTSVVVVN